MIVGILDPPPDGKLIIGQFLCKSWIENGKPSNAFNRRNYTGVKNAKEDLNLVCNEKRGAENLYDIPLYVVPTSKASTSLRLDPR